MYNNYVYYLFKALEDFRLANSQLKNHHIDSLADRIWSFDIVSKGMMS